VAVYPLWRAIGVNGVHAVVVAPVLVRIELFRARRTCQLLITKHETGRVKDGRRPTLQKRILFRGVNGLVDPELLRTGDDLGARSVLPESWSRAGEEFGVPGVFAGAVRAATKGANCVGCSHSHYLVTPVAVVEAAVARGTLRKVDSKPGPLEPKGPASKFVSDPCVFATRPSNQPNRHYARNSRFKFTLLIQGQLAASFGSAQPLEAI
jgi:hypothetical protein